MGVEQVLSARHVVKTSGAVVNQMDKTAPALRELTVQLRSSGGQERTDAVEVAAGGCQLGWEVREGLF